MEATKDKFLSDINQIVDEFFSEPGYPTPLKDHMKTMIEYMTLPYDKTMIPPIIYEILKIINPNLSDEEMQTGASVAWIYQLFEAHACLQDDYLDYGDVRYGKMSWVKLREYVRPVIVHDDSFLRTITFTALRKLFPDSPSTYIQLSDIFFEFDNVLLRSGVLDQYLQIKNVPSGKIDLDTLSQANYDIMATLKGTGFFFLPLFSALVLAGYDMNKNPKMWKDMREICDDLGAIAQVVDDYYDLYHPRSVNPGASHDIDIRKGQFTWLFLMVKDKGTKEQVQELMETYGVDTDEAVVRIKKLFGTFGFTKMYQEYHDGEHVKIAEKVEKYFKDDEVIYKVMKWFVPWIKKFIAVDALEVYY